MSYRLTIRQLLRSFRTDQAHAGQALVVIALSFTALMGIAALAVDIGYLTMRKRTLDQIASGAALSGAQYILSTQDPPVLDWDAARDSATAYVNDRLAATWCETSSVLITPPTSSAYQVDAAQYIQVDVSCQTPLFFARTFAAPSQSLRAVALARGVRPANSNHALVALGGGFQLEGIGQAWIEGNVISHTSFSRLGGSTATLDANGFIAASVDGSPTLSLIAPTPQTTFISPAVPAVFADPIQGDLTLRGITLPTLPSGGTCPPGASVRVIDAPAPGLTPTPPPPPGAEYSPYTARPGECVDIQHGETRFPGGQRYGPVIVCATCQAIFRSAGSSVRSITVNGGTVQFEDGDYRIERLDVRTNSFVWSDTNSANGVYLQIGDSMLVTGAARFSLKGRRQYLDIGIHLPAADDPGHVKSIQLINASTGGQSQLVGSVYAPNSLLYLQGNRPSGPPLARLTRSGNGTQRGGRAVAWRVQVFSDAASAASHSVVADYPPINNDYALVPALMPVNPSTP